MSDFMSDSDVFIAKEGITFVANGFNVWRMEGSNRVPISDSDARCNIRWNGTEISRARAERLAMERRPRPAKSA